MLELSVEFNSATSKEMIGFMVPKNLDNRVYRLVNMELKSVKGLLHGTEGTYGFADLGIQSELPYFEHKSAINILKSCDDGLVGSIEM